MEASLLNPLAPPFSQRLAVFNSPMPQLDTIRSTVYSELGSIAKGNSDDAAISNLADMYTYFYSSITSLELKIESSCSQNLGARLNKLERELEYINYENSQLKFHLASIEDATKYMNLRIEGMNEHNNNNLLNQAAKVLSKTGIQCHPSDLDYARRIGKFRTGYNRPVLVRFMRESKRNSILYARNNINKKRAPNSKAPLLWVNDDVSDVTRRNRKNVRDIATLAKQQGDDSIRIHGDGLVVGDGKFRHRDLDLLPVNLALERAKTREESEEIFFQGELSPLSNFYPANIESDDSLVFCSAEQAFQFRKATYFSWDLTADKIKKTRDPYEIKRLSNLLPTSDEWKATEYQTMAEIVYLKFSQNANLRRILLETGDKALHEATNNEFWAIGAELSSKALENRAWEGLDMLGNILVELRQNLSVEYPTLSPSPPTGECINDDHSIEETDMRPLSDDEGSVHENENDQSHIPHEPALNQSGGSSGDPPPPPSLPPPPQPQPAEVCGTTVATAATTAPTPTTATTAPHVSDTNQNRHNTQSQRKPMAPGNQKGPNQKCPVPKTTSLGSQSNNGPSQSTPTPKTPVTPSSRQTPRTTADYFTPKQGTSVASTHSVSTATGSRTAAPTATTTSGAPQADQQRPIRSSQRVTKKTELF